MAKKEVEKKALKKGLSKFNLVGEAKVNNYTFKLNEESQKSDWIYSIMNLGVDCGNGNVVYSELMGGYGAERDNVIYVHGKKPLLDEDGEPRKNANGEVVYTDDFDNRFTIDWDDRKDPDILDTIGDLCFITVGLEQVATKKKDSDGKPVMQTVYEKFLSAYDAIEYIHEHLEDGMVINVSGDIQYQLYDGKTTIKKNIKSIALSKATPDKYRATFQQTILIDRNSVGKFNKTTNSYPITARVIDYHKIVKGDKTIFKGNTPFFTEFEIVENSENPSATKAFLDMAFKVRKDITELAVEGNIIEGSALVEISDDDIDDDILALINAGVLSREEIENKQAVGSKRVRRWIITKPYVRIVKKDDETKPVLVRTEQAYTEEDLDVLPFEEVNEDEVPFDDDVDVSEDDNDMSWLDALSVDDDEIPFN